jgi:hypothetical protein
MRKSGEGWKRISSHGFRRGKNQSCGTPSFAKASAIEQGLPDLSTALKILQFKVTLLGVSPGATE